MPAKAGMDSSRPGRMGMGTGVARGLSQVAMTDIYPDTQTSGPQNCQGWLLAATACFLRGCLTKSSKLRRCKYYRQGQKMSPINECEQVHMCVCVCVCMCACLCVYVCVHARACVILLPESYKLSIITTKFHVEEQCKTVHHSGPRHELYQVKAC